MIRLSFNLKNPWHNEQKQPWRDFYQRAWRLSKNKTLEICFDFYPYTLAQFNLDTTWRGRDHAGPEISLGLVGLGLQIQIVDNRHWNYDTNDWRIYDRE